MQRNLHFIRTRPSQLANQAPIKNKNKLLILILKRIIYKSMHSTLTSLNNYSITFTKKMQRLQRICSANNEIFLYIGWNKMKSYTKSKRNQVRIIKDIMILAKRIEKTLLQQYFNKLNQYVNTTNAIAYEKIINSRKTIMGHLLKKLYIKSKKCGLNQLKSNLIQHKINKKVNSIHLIFQNIQKKNLLRAWPKLKNYNTKQFFKQKDNKIQDLQLQLQDMKIQVENKNQNISRLYDEITQLKQNSVMKPGDTSSFIFNNSFGNRSGSNLNRSRSKNNYSGYDRQKDKQSNQGSIGIGRDNSFGSLLGISVLSYRSRGNSVANINNISGKIQSCACSNCHYRQKYQKYKATSETLKKQLDIIKAQLDFTKDMNQHMENELNSQYSNADQQRKLQKVRFQLRECQKQRQALKDKVLKYQKYVAKLKSQFKIRIQEIYRRVKRNT